MVGDTRVHHKADDGSDSEESDDKSDGESEDEQFQGLEVVDMMRMVSSQLIQ